MSFVINTSFFTIKLWLLKWSNPGSDLLATCLTLLYWVSSINVFLGRDLFLKWINVVVLFWRYSAILHARLFRLKAVVCSKIILRGCFSLWSSWYCAPTWFNGLFFSKPLSHWIQILSLLDDAIIFLLLPLLYTSEREETKKSIMNPKILGIVKVQEMTAADNQK